MVHNAYRLRRSAYLTDARVARYADNKVTTFFGWCCGWEKSIEVREHLARKYEYYYSAVCMATLPETVAPLPASGHGVVWRTE